MAGAPTHLTCLRMGLGMSDKTDKSAREEIGHLMQGRGGAVFTVAAVVLGIAFIVYAVIG